MKLTTLIAALLTGAEALAGATVDETEVELNTYMFSDPDPVPATGTLMYPYFRYNGQTAKGTPRRWKAVVLENPKIKVTAVPEIGGKIWGATDKVTGRDFIYFNHAAKFRNIAMRGPWCSGGIEFNFGVLGHSPATACPVDWTVKRHSDGSVSYFCGTTEFITRAFWQVEVRLGPDDDFFTTHVVWHNGSKSASPYYQWMNAAYKASGDPEFLYPGSAALGHDGNAAEWPVDAEGRDLTRYRNGAFGGSHSWHVVNGDTRFFGVWWPEDGYGSYHENRCGEKFGRKIFYWSHSRAGGIWEDLLTDSDGQYVELQSGRGFEQPRGTAWKTPFRHPTFLPGQTDRFTEKWGVLRSRADAEKFLAKDSQVERPLTLPADFDWKSAYGRYLEGQQELRFGENAVRGRKLLEEALAIDPNFVPALDCLAACEYSRGRFAAARALCARALAVDSYDAEANWTDGLCAARQGAKTVAMERFGLAAYSPAYRAPAMVERSLLALAAGNREDARDFAERAFSADDANPEASMAYSVACGRDNRAKAWLQVALIRLPLHQGLRYECYKNGLMTKAEFLGGFTCELPGWNFTELGDWYENAGLSGDALELYGFAGDDLLARVRAAALLARLGRRDEADAALAAAAKLKVAFANPFRAEDRAALEFAADAGKSWKFDYLLGVYLAAKGEDAAARFELSKCDAADEACVFLFRAKTGAGAEKLADLKRARELDAGWRPVAALADHYEDVKDHPAMLAVTAPAVKAVATPVNEILLAHARALLLNGKYRECVDYLKTVTVLPSELNKRDNASAIWKEACGKLGETALAESYPENLGVGRPFPKAKGGFTVRMTDPVEWLYPDSRVAECRAFRGIDVAANGVADVNFLLNGLDVVKPLEVECDLGGEWYRMLDVPVEQNTGVDCMVERKDGPKNPYVTRRAPFRVYDALEPFTAKVTPKAETGALRWRLASPPGGASGETVAHFTLKQGDVVRKLEFRITVHPVKLPEVGRDSFKYTNWINFENVASRHGLEKWSDGHYEMLGRYAALAVKSRQNFGWIPIATVFTVKDGRPVFDEARFRRLVETYTKAGIWYLEGGHVAYHHGGEWGAATLDAVLTKNPVAGAQGAGDIGTYARELAAAVTRLGLEERWYQHVSDEPCKASAGDYLKAAAIVRKAMPWAKIVDAVELADVLSGMDVVCPKPNDWTRSRKLYDDFQRTHPHGIWTYVCCVPGGRWMNRLMDGELLRPVYLPWGCSLFGIDGFLHWGYNMYGAKQNPFGNSCRGSFGPNGDGTLPAGDTHLVYPGTDGPWPGVRSEATRAGMEDREALELLRAKNPRRCDELIRRLVRGFDDYTADARLYREVRREVLKEAE